jgi:hypothetical protein
MVWLYSTSTTEMSHLKNTKDQSRTWLNRKFHSPSYSATDILSWGTSNRARFPHRKIPHLLSRSKDFSAIAIIYAPYSIPISNLSVISLLMYTFYVCVIPCSVISCKGKGKAIPLQASTGPEGSRMLRLPEDDISHMKMLRSSSLRTGHLYP